MNDLISRKAAIDLISVMPAAQSEQKKEKWIPIYYDNKAMFYQCPYCGARYMLQTRFCGNCGKVVYHE